jgi:hypothetical protein
MLFAEPDLCQWFLVYGIPELRQLRFTVFLRVAPGRSAESGQRGKLAAVKAAQPGFMPADR